VSLTSSHAPSTILTFQLDAPFDNGPSNTASLEALQSDEQRLVLDTVAQVRKCGLESILALPQLVVCGDQSAGKSSVLEALTEIPFPRNDELCTRFATEIIMRRATVDSLTIKVIPDEERPSSEKESIQTFTETIKDFDELPTIMDRAMAVMGIGPSGPQSSAFARDVLSVEIEGPSRPQLTFVDLPGLIQNETKGVTKADVELVQEITDRYISQSRTIILAVVSATNDYANQGILTKARKVDPDGERTLGIITKPDRLPAGSGSESAYINLARNEDIFFKLGWHVIKNRSFEEGNSSFEERNASEASYFRHSNFKCLQKGTVGIDSLRERLSRLLFEHVKQELPKLHSDLNKALDDSKQGLSMLGNRRSSPEDCREYLMQLSLDFHEVCGAAAKGQYEGSFFRYDSDTSFTPQSSTAIRRLRAMVQKMNAEFSKNLRTTGHTYFMDRSGDITSGELGEDAPLPPPNLSKPVTLSHTESLRWVIRAIIRNRGRELQGNFNPLIIGELFWEQSARWRSIATNHIEDVVDVCRLFLHDLLQELCPKDVQSRLSTSHIEEAVKSRCEAASKELAQIMEDLREHPINYNHYYTDTVDKCRVERECQSIVACVQKAAIDEPLPGCQSDHTSVRIDYGRLREEYSQSRNPDMDISSCETALDGLIAIYKVSLKPNDTSYNAYVRLCRSVRRYSKQTSPLRWWRDMSFGVLKAYSLLLL
jgi:GTPase SAR1 family protein